MQLIKVLHVLDKFSLSSGVSSVVINLYRNLDKQKFHFDFLVHEETPAVFVDEIESYGGKIYRMPELKYVNTIKYIKALDEFFKSNGEYDIVHGHIANAAIFYLIAAKVNGVNLRIIHSHSTKPSQRIIKKIRNYILQAPVKMVANQFVACSEASAVYLFGKSAFLKENVFVLKNAINTEKFIFNAAIRENTRKRFNIDNKLAVGHVGRFSEEKNHRFILSTFIELCKIVPNACLLLIGDGPLEEEIKYMAQREQIYDKVIFLGKRNDINILLQAMDVFILPSLFEGLPVSVLEAQASGLKCFVSENVTKEVNVTGLVEFLSLAEDSKKWAQKISNSGCQYLRENQYKSFTESGFDIKAQADRLEKYYLSIINNQ